MSVNPQTVHHQLSVFNHFHKISMSSHSNTKWPKLKCPKFTQTRMAATELQLRQLSLY